MKKEIKESDVFIGQYFTQLRIEHRYTQEQICDILNIKRSAYSNYERGTRGMPFSVIDRLCKLYHLDFKETVTYLINTLEKKGMYFYE